MLNTARPATGLIDAAVKEILKRLKLVETIKKLWRTRLTEGTATE